MNKNLSTNDNLNREDMIEKKAMWFGFFINLVMAVAGWYMFITTNVDALFLDANFSLISALSCVAAVFISRYSNRKTKTFPNGMNFLEPLYGILKSGLSIYLIAVAGYSAVEKLYRYFNYNEGELLKSGHIVVYSISMIILCFGLSYVFTVMNRKINENSIMLKVESKASLVDGVISLGVGAAIILVSILPKSGNFIILHYVADSIITILLIIGTWRQPVEAFRDSFIELTHGLAQSKDIRDTIEKIVYELDEENRLLDIEEVKIYKVGKRLTVTAKINEKETDCTVEDLIMFRDEVKRALSEKYSRLNFQIIIS